MMDSHDLEQVISRIVDGEASPQEWERFRALASGQPSLWQDLGEAQRDHAELSAYVSAGVACAERIEAPVDRDLAAPMHGRLRLVATWGGWAAAAAVALAWLGGPLGPLSRTTVPTGASMAGLAPLSSDEAFRRYLEQGQREGVVLGEIPDRVMLESRPTGKGVEVIYVRQILERAIVSEMFRVGQDELGRPTPVRIEIVRPASPPL